jgi:hypothetical protein
MRIYLAYSGERHEGFTVLGAFSDAASARAHCENVASQLGIFSDRQWASLPWETEHMPAYVASTPAWTDTIGKASSYDYAECGIDYFMVRGFEVQGA